MDAIRPTRPLARPVFAWVFAIVLGLSACGDDEPSTRGPADTVADVGSDVAPDEGTEPDVEDSGVDTADTRAADTEIEDVADEEVTPDPCAPTASCFDPNFDRPRAALCTEAGFPPGTACVLLPDRADACCIPPFECETDEDCEAAREVEGFCPDERYACVCNTEDGSCSPFLCVTDEDCDTEGDICRGGECTEPGSRDGLVARVLMADGVIAEGEAIALLAVAVDPDDPGRIFDDVAIDWSTDASQRVDISDGDAVGQAEPGPATLTATVADNDDDPGDTVVLTNLVDSEAALRVMVINEDGGTPVEGATVLVEPDSGDAVLDETGADGAITLDSAVATPFSVSVFADGFAYVTHVGLDTDDVLVVLPPVQWAEVAPEEELEDGADAICEEVRGETLCYALDGVGAVVGYPDFEWVANSGEIDVSLTGFALGNSLLDLNFELLVGPPIKRDLSEGPIPSAGLAEIPGGVTLAFNRDPMVPTFVATALPGERTMWSIGGRVSLSENPSLLPDIIEEIGGNIDIAKIIAIVLPLFRDFYSGIETDIPVMLPEGEDLNLYEAVPSLEVPVGRNHIVEPPMLPDPASGPLETGLFLPGARIPGEGFVPLGITAAVDGAGDTPVDLILDGEPEDEDADPVPLNMAPIHGGIDTPQTRYVLVAVALSLEDPSDRQRRENSSGLILRMAEGMPLPDTVSFDDYVAFPPLAEQSTYTPETRTIEIVGHEDFEADFYRVLFKDNEGRTWQIHLPSDVATYVVPNPADYEDAFDDLTARDKVSVIGIRFDDDETSLGYHDLLVPGANNFSRLIDFVGAFTIAEIGD